VVHGTGEGGALPARAAVLPAALTLALVLSLTLTLALPLALHLSLALALHLALALRLPGLATAILCTPAAATAPPASALSGIPPGGLVWSDHHVLILFCPTLGGSCFVSTLDGTESTGW